MPGRKTFIVENRNFIGRSKEAPIHAYYSKENTCGGVPL